jgi:hypothetical protein
LLNLYYGRKIPENMIEGFAIRARNASFSPADSVMGEGDFAPDSAPIEYGCDGAGDFRISAIKVQNHNGDSVTDLRYLSHKIYQGKPFIKDMPASFAEKDEATTLEIATVDKVTNLQVTLVYTVFETLGVMTKSVQIKNNSDKDMFIERAFSLCNDFPKMDFDLISLYGRHYFERKIERRALAHGLQGVESNKGISSHCQNPFVALVSKDADEESGEAYGFNLVYSGNFSALAECDYNDSTRLIMGINPNHFSWKLRPAEVFYTPEAVCVYSPNGLGEMSRTFHKFYNKHLIKWKHKYEKRPVLINSWEAAYFDINSEKLLDFAVAAKDLGIDMVKKQVENRFYREMETPQAYVLQVWHGKAKHTLKDQLIVSTFGEILSQRYLKSIREDGGLSYSVNSSASLSYGLKDEFVLETVCPFTPEKADSVLLLMKQGIEEIAQNGVTEDELSKVKAYKLKSFKDNQTKNEYWQSLILAKTNYGKDQSENYEELVKNISSKDIQKFVKKYLLKQNNCASIIMLPASLKP